MAEGATQPVDGRSPTLKRDTGPRSLGGALVVVLLAIVPPLIGYLTGPGSAFFTALSSFKLAPAFHAGFAGDIARYSLPLLVFAIPPVLGMVRNAQDYWGGVALAAFAFLRSGPPATCLACAVSRLVRVLHRGCSRGSWS